MRGKRKNATLSIKGIFDGREFIALEDFPRRKKCKVVITFLEELDGSEDVRSFAAQSDAFSFWENEKEDLYQDYLVKR